MSVPALRFPEFEGEWDEKRLGDMFPKVRNGFVGTATPYYDNEGIPYLQGKNVKSGAIDPKGLIRIQAAFHQKQKKSQLKAGDLLMVQSGHVGECAVVTEEFSGGNCHALVVMTPNNSVEPEFMRDLFYAPVGQQHIGRIKTGNTIEHVLTSDLKPLQLFVPTLPEQKKIAAFLGVVDEKLAALGARKAGLETYKRGLMQKLFSRTLRFTKPDGSPFPDWEEKRLGDVFQERSERGNENAELLSVTLSNGVLRASQVTRANSASADRSNYKTVQVGDLAYNSMRMWQGANGVSKFDGIVSPAYTVITLRGDHVQNYWGYCFKLTKSIQEFQRRSQGLTSDTWNLKFPALARIKMMVPHPEEQTLIANALQTLDAKIQTTADQITRMEAFKKGLLQQMFV